MLSHSADGVHLGVEHGDARGDENRHQHREVGVGQQLSEKRPTRR